MSILVYIVGMQRLVFLLSFIFILISTQAVLAIPKPATAPKNRSQFCETLKDPSYTRRQLLLPENMLAFKNDGGLLNKGFCWWHSMFTRNANYLAYFRPDLPAPSVREAMRIIHAIQLGNQVVQIPGYANLRSFSAAFADLIRNTLNSWQITDGVLGFGFIEGLSGKTEVSAEQLKQMMDALFVSVTKKNQVTYQRLQNPGIGSHSWLVIDMQAVENGYVLTVVDSNKSRPVKHFYQFGDTKILDFVPYTSRNRVATLAGKFKKIYCQKTATTNRL